ncbi:MAG: CubicO group peptidase (beta-lactamase class C family), partial [Candidatus Paceibacteria bacterium]
MRKLRVPTLSCLFLSALTSSLWALQSEVYYPPRGEWETRLPEEVGMDPGRLLEAVNFAIEHEAETAVDLREYISSTLANEPHGDIVGPVRNRGEMTGLIIHRGYLVAEWGDPQRVDMTFSVTKTYLSSVVGLAHDRGLIPDLQARVSQLVPTEHFEGDHNGVITWDHLLRQTSDWRGTLFDKPDWADRPPQGIALEDLPTQAMHAPGTHWKYNDVRVNLLAWAALQVWREPLPVVLRRELMDPIGASPSWRWNGYENSWVVIDGQRIQSVSGGGHWGGGMWINSFDHARFGYLFLREGLWQDRQ